MKQEIKKVILENGLTVILKESPTVPVSSFWVWYRVGSRNERSGITGVSHWVEHMMFKGSPSFPSGSLDRLIAREGGRFNAFTSRDYTAYFELMPADRIDLALRLEAERMTQALFLPEDVASERGVVIAERQMYENSPMFALQEEIQAAAFRVHPYHHEIIGDQVDLETMSRDDLYGHYQQYYAPNNAVIVIVGQFETEKMLARIEELFAHLPSQPAPPAVLRHEPVQKGERRTTVEGAGQTAYLSFSYRVPGATDPDYFPLALLNAAFSGGSGLSGIAGGGTNKTSRLYKAIVKPKLAVAAFGSLAPSIDPFLFSFLAIVHPTATRESLEKGLEDAIADLSEHPVTQKELDKAIKRSRSQFIMAGETVSGQGRMLGLSEMLANDYQWAEKAVAKLQEVTLDDIERVRQKYLRVQNRVVGWYIPK